MDITEKEYLNAVKIVRLYQDQIDRYNSQYEEDQQQKFLNAKKGDYITYIGGSSSKYLIKGKQYRLTGTPYRRIVNIVADSNKRMRLSNSLFKI
jgi:hypothetical protein